jgi:hypothetical protein
VRKSHANGGGSVTVCHGCHGSGEEETEVREDGPEEIGQEGEAAGSELLRSEAGKPSTIVFADWQGMPMVKDVKLHRLTLGRPVPDGPEEAKLEFVDKSSSGRWCHRQSCIARDFPSPFIIFDKHGVNIALPPLPHPHTMLTDPVAYRSVWKAITDQARVPGRNILFDTVDEAIAHEERKAAGTRP